MYSINIWRHTQSLYYKPELGQILSLAINVLITYLNVYAKTGWIYWLILIWYLAVANHIGQTENAGHYIASQMLQTYGPYNTHTDMHAHTRTRTHTHTQHTTQQGQPLMIMYTVTTGYKHILLLTRHSLSVQHLTKDWYNDVKQLSTLQ